MERCPRGRLPHAMPQRCPAHTRSPVSICRSRRNIPRHLFLTTLGCRDCNFQFHRPGSGKSCDLRKVPTRKRQNRDADPDPRTAVQNPGPSSYTTPCLDVRVTSQQRAPPVWSRLHTPSGSLVGHFPSLGLRFPIHTGGDGLHANNN